MNLKEAFRYQNKLDQHIAQATEVLNQPRNILITENTYLRRKAVSGAENETIADTAPFEMADHITELADLAVMLIGEREKLYGAIKAAKLAAPIDIDTETSLNNQRQSLASVFRGMLSHKSREEILTNAGIGYCMNAEGNQIQYRCDIKRVTTINFDRKHIQSELKKLNKKADEVSAKIDEAIITAQVDYSPVFDVNDTFEDVFEAYLSR